MGCNGLGFKGLGFKGLGFKGLGLVTHNYRQLCSNFLLLWIEVPHYYG